MVSCTECHRNIRTYVHGSQIKHEHVGHTALSCLQHVKVIANLCMPISRGHSAEGTAIGALHGSLRAVLVHNNQEHFEELTLKLKCTYKILINLSN